MAFFVGVHCFVVVLFTASYAKAGNNNNDIMMEVQQNSTSSIVINASLCA